MEYVHYTNSPKVEDKVGFVLETYGDDGVLRNPYSIEKVTVLYIEKNAHKNERFIETKELHPEIQKAYEELQAQLQQDSSKENLTKLATFQEKASKATVVKRLFYSNSKTVMETPSPLWVAGAKSRGVTNLTDNDTKEPLDGKFVFLWVPKDMREGTYLIRWHWKNTKDGKTHTAEKLFTLYPAEQKINSIYRNFVPRDKYTFLFDKYIPPMYRVQTTPNDITPDTLVKLNRAVAQCLLELDDLAVGLIDLLNPTYIPEGFLPAMANFFNLELRSTHPTAWRNQIRQALPLYKKKGTIEGLQGALDKAGIRLVKLSNLWQVVSPYTWTDGFAVDKDSHSGDIVGHLSKRPLDYDKIEVYIKSAETQEYFLLPPKTAYLNDILVPEARVALIWNGEEHSEPINLFKGDVIKIKYTYNKIPEDAKQLENYIQSLPLADQRNESEVRYPLKNWNVKLIEEDDPFFDLLIPERHSFQSPVVFGRIRTTFLYSEKAFNMDTYNGSLYSSNSPCDMDKDYIDTCTGGQSSKFNVHLEFEQATDEKIKEAKEIITDYSPFHAILHNMKISNKVTDFIMPPVEKIKTEIKSKPKNGDKIGCQDAIYCQIRYKDGRVENGRVA